VKSFRGIWFKVTLEHADWVPILAKVCTLFTIFSNNERMI
jgi:hypothetical protein